MDNLAFSEEEIQEQLATLGYKNIPTHRLLEFKQDLDELIRRGEWRNLASSTERDSSSQRTRSQPGPPAFTKEKVGQYYFDGSSEQFFLHADKTDSDRPNRDCGEQKGHCDSYAQYTVAAKLQLPSGASARLRVEPDLENTPQSQVSDGYTSSPDSHGGHFIKRKVLRKHKGQSFVCDESVYSEDHTLRRSTAATMYKMYDTRWDKDSDDDKNSLSSSFWSDGDKDKEEDEEREEVQIHRGTDSRPVNNAEDSPKEAPEEKSELNNQNNFTAESLEEGSDVDEEKEVQVEGFINSKPVSNAEHPAKEEESEQDNQGTSTADSFQEESDEEDEDEQDEEESFDDEGEEEEEEVNDEEEDGENEKDNEQEEEEGSDDEEEGRVSFDKEEDGKEEEEEEEEEVQTKGVIDSKPVNSVEDSVIDAPEEELSVLKKQGSITGESLKVESDDDDGEEEEEDDGCSTSSDSPAPSLMTSGYGTYRPEEGGDYRDDHTITEFDQDSRGDLSEMRDDEEDSRSLCSFVEFDIEPTHEADFSETATCALEDNKIAATPARCESPTEVSADEEDPEEDLCAASENDAANGSLEGRPHAVAAEETLLVNKDSEDGSDNRDEKPEEEQDFHKNVETEEESDGPDDSSNNKDIKFIDSRVDLNWTAYDRMCIEWEGNLRQKKLSNAGYAASCLEEQLDKLHLSAPRDSEVEGEDVMDHSDTQSSDTGDISLSAFESYIRQMTRTQSDVELRPRPKSFIRPVMSRQTIKKTDPVARYFQYKEHWNMFNLPREKDRRFIRWEIKERLAYQPPPPKPQKVFVPNTYIVPTEKKRSALRWSVRNDLANGLLPHKLGYRS